MTNKNDSKTPPPFPNRKRGRGLLLSAGRSPSNERPAQRGSFAHAYSSGAGSSVTSTSLSSGSTFSRTQRGSGVSPNLKSAVLNSS